MENVHLIIPFEDFKKKVEQAVQNVLPLKSLSVVTEQDLAAFTEQKKNWENEVVEILRSSFNNVNNSFVNEFRSKSGQYSFVGLRSNIPESVDKRHGGLLQTLNIKQHFLSYILPVIGVCDAITLNPKVDISKRATYTTKEKWNFILEKLYQLNDGQNYSIELLLTGNGIPLKSSSEIRELAKMLETDGYIKTLGGAGADIGAAITSPGSMYIEERGIAYQENYDDVPNDQDKVNEKIDDIIAQLKTMGYGQEVLFNELQDIKELYGKLSKKNWGEIVKGKMVDLALGKIVETDTLKHIYNELIGHALKLIQ